MKKQNKTSHLQFMVQSSCLSGQSVFITGNILSLGAWNPKKGFRLFQDQQNTKIWKSLQPVQIQLSEKIEFKVIRLDNEGNVYWEHLFQNRSYQNLFPQGKILKFKQGDPKIQINSINLKIISYRRNLFDILDDLESETTQSFNFQSNYQIQSYFKQNSKNSNKKLVSISKIIFNQDRVSDQPIQKLDSHKLNNQCTQIIEANKQNFQSNLFEDCVIQTTSNNSVFESNSLVLFSKSITDINHSQQQQGEDDWIQSWQNQNYSSKNNINYLLSSKNNIKPPLSSTKTIIPKISKTVKELMTRKKIF